MLQGNFYTISSPVTENNTLQAVMNINAAHQIFEGHFPGQPIVPGVCMMQIVKELAGQLSRKDLLLQKADFLKFLTMINPVETANVTIHLKIATTDEGVVRVDAQFFNEGVTYFKFKGNFTELI